MTPKLREFDFDEWREKVNNKSDDGYFLHGCMLFKKKDNKEICIYTRCGMKISSLAYLEELQIFYGSFFGTFLGNNGRTFDICENLYEKWDKSGKSYFNDKLDLMLEDKS